MVRKARDTMINKSSQKIFNNSLMYSLGTVASKAVGFFLVPLYTHFMSTESYGIATTIITFVSTFGIVVMLSLRAAMIRFYNEYSKEEQATFVGTIVSTVLINALVICSLLCVVNRLYMPFLFKGISFFPCVFWGVLSLGTEGIYLVYQSLLQARQDGVKYSLNSMVYLFFHAITVIIFVVILKMDALGLVLSNFTTNFCFALYGIYSMAKHKYMTFSFNATVAKKSLKYSLPILPHNLLSHLNVYSTKLIINNNLTYILSGLYTLASQFSTILSLVQNSVNLAFRPWFIEQMQSGEEGRKQIKHMSCMIISLYSFCGLAVSLFGKEIIILMTNKAYIDAWKMIPVFIATQLVAFVYYSHVQTLMYNVKMSKYTVVCSLSGFIANVVFSLVFVKNYGIYGVLVGQLAAQIVLAIVTVVLSRKTEKVDFGLPKMVGYIIMASVIIAVGMLIALKFGNSLSLMEIAIKLGLILVGFFVLILPYAKDYMQLITGIVKKRKK